MLARKVAVIFKTGHPEAEELAGRIHSWLASRAIDCIVMPAGAVIPDDVEFAVVLGGDGTIIGTGRRLADTCIPILGVNFGAVGFLAPFSPEAWQSALECALAGNLRLQTCLTLAWRIMRNGEIVAAGSAINDVVIGRGSLARLVNLAASISGGGHLNVRSDGIVVASPPGSPGYCASAGGPILLPELDCMALVPICPYGGASPPLVLSGSSTVAIRIGKGSGDCYLTVDGQEGRELRGEDLVEISGRPDSLRLMTAAGVFFSKLRNWGAPGERRGYLCQDMKR